MLVFASEHQEMKKQHWIELLDVETIEQVLVRCSQEVQQQNPQYVKYGTYPVLNNFKLTQPDADTFADNSVKNWKDIGKLYKYFTL